MASDDAPEQSLFGKFFGRSVPAYLWIAVFYLIYVLVIAVPEMASSVVGGDESTQTAETAETAETADTEAETAAASTTSTRVANSVEEVLRTPIVSVTLFSGVPFPISWTTIFIIAGFVSAWIEALRATNVRISGNDFMSLIVTIVSLVLFVGVPWFSTTAFMIVPLVGIGDLILDRYIGQAVARRDFGPLHTG